MCPVIHNNLIFYMKLTKDRCIFRFPEILEGVVDLYNLASGIVDAALENRAMFVAVYCSLL